MGDETRLQKEENEAPESDSGSSRHRRRSRRRRHDKHKEDKNTDKDRHRPHRQRRRRASSSSSSSTHSPRRKYASFHYGDWNRAREGDRRRDQYTPPGVRRNNVTADPSGGENGSAYLSPYEIQMQRKQRELHRYAQQAQWAHQERDKYIQRHYNVSAQRNVLFSVLLVLAFFLLCIIWRWAARTSSETQKNRRDAEQQISYAHISLGHARRAHRRGQLSRRNQSPSSSTSTYTQGDIVSSLWATQACQCLNTAKKILQASTDAKLEKKRDPKLNPRFATKGDDEESDDQAVTRGPQNENLSVSQIRSEAKKYQLVNHGGEVCPCVARGPEAKYMGTA